MDYFWQPAIIKFLQEFANSNPDKVTVEVRALIGACGITSASFVNVVTYRL